MDTAVIALGGNALQPKDSSGTIQEQRAAIRETVDRLEPVLDRHEVVLTHGNGPQVGDLLLQQAEASDAGRPLDVLVAETQAQIGYLLQQEIRNRADRAAATIITQVLVDEHDEGFDEPTKPVGPYYTAEEAEEKEFPTMQVDDSDRPYRRVVPSPAPRQVLEVYQVERLLRDDTIPICCGGGGVPVVRDGDGFHGVEAVIDKDHASQVLATTLDADVLCVLTDVDYAYRHYGTDEQEPIEAATADELARLLEQDAFGAGSMRPKVAAAVRFIRNGGKRACITSLANARDGMAGDAGTQVTR